MWSLLRFAFLSALAVAVGIAAVSVPIGGKTPAEYVRSFLETHFADEPPTASTNLDPPKARNSSPKASVPSRATREAPPPRQAKTGASGSNQAAKGARASRGAEERGIPRVDEQAPAENPTDEDRAALERLLNERIR